MTKTTHYLALALYSVFFLISCNNDNDFNLKENSKESILSNDTTLIRKRKSKIPIILSNKDITSTKEMSINDIPDVLDIKYFLGRSYDITNTSIGNPDGVKFPVVDIENFLNDNPGYYNAVALRILEAKSFSFSSFNRYDEKSKGSDKISAGFSLDLGIFSIGSKHKFTNAFSSQIINENKRVFGELNVNIQDASYNLLVSTNTLNKIKYKYLDPSFVDELYNSPTKEVIDNYGRFVLTDYITGGRANALFTGIYNSNSSTEIKEFSMDNSINASYGVDSVEGAIDFGFGNSDGSSIAAENNISQFSSSIKTYGGSYGFGSFTVPKSIDDININLSGWAASLNDPEKTVLIDVNDEGLIPVSEFIFEDNFRENIIEGFNTTLLHTPVIELHYNLIGVNHVTPILILKTRFKDNLIMSNSDVVLRLREDIYSGAYDINDAIGFFDNTTLNKLNFYDLNVEGISNIYPVSKDLDYFEVFDINENTMQKFYNQESNILYLLYNSNNKKFAYAIHDDYILDTYGIRNWVDNMQSTQVSSQELANYTVIGL